MNRLALGTAQFGLNYGIANQTGQISIKKGQEIINAAKKSGIDTLDTAILYGKSEDVLGNIGITNLKVITKLPEISQTKHIKSHIKQLLKASFKRLKVDKVAGLLLHRPLQLLEPGYDKIYQVLKELRQEGLVEKIGYSIYSPTDLDVLWDSFHPDIVQAPFSVFDRRLLATGWLHKMHQAGTEVHTRSIFLQGLLLMDKDSRPTKFQKWENLWSKWYTWLKSQDISAVQAALNFVLSHQEINRVVIGVDNVLHLKEILRMACDSDTSIIPDSIFSNDELLLNPANWEQI
ncbi:MAG: aldo/keto reductase [Deltaproteobacteria bacterium]|jgi:aryl-alcohol dehydrogenase-like predicted oxidoreductase|nr:aldo/keto reductase [Deltaproteobacteria bacterium]